MYALYMQFTDIPLSCIHYRMYISIFSDDRRSMNTHVSRVNQSLSLSSRHTSCQILRTRCFAVSHPLPPDAIHLALTNIRISRKTMEIFVENSTPDIAESSTSRGVCRFTRVSETSRIHGGEETRHTTNKKTKGCGSREGRAQTSYTCTHVYATACARERRSL